MLIVSRLSPSNPSTDHAPSFNTYTIDKQPKCPQSITLEKYCRALAEWMKEQQGTHLQIYAASVVTPIFRQQSIFWGSITRDYVQECHRHALDFMEAAVMYVAGDHTGRKLMQIYIEPAFERKETTLSEKVSDLLWPYLRTHPITYNPMFNFKTTSENGEKYSERIKAEAKDTDLEPHLIIAAQALDQAETYYEVGYAGGQSRPWRIAE